MEDFIGATKFMEILDDQECDPKKVKRLLFCTGKIYYDLYKKRAEMKMEKNIAVVRLEQLYPFPKKQIKLLLEKYTSANTIKWVQEEPENMGAWRYIMNRMRRTEIEVVSRKSSASPATGYKKVHDQQQQDIVNEALGIKQK
jgi:2-oxoglutarate dehydrogenase E1 component